MRPAGEIRQALSQAAVELEAEIGAATWRDMAERAQVGYVAACRTVENMARAGALERVGSAKREHSRRWMALYVPATPAVQPPQPMQARAVLPSALDLAMRGWMRR